MLKVGKIKTRLNINESLLSYIAIGLGLFLFIFWRLGSISRGLSAAEYRSRAVSSDLNGLLNNCVDAPYHLLQSAAIKLHPGILSLRLVSAVVAVIIVLGFYFYVRPLFGRLIGLLGSLLLISLPFFAISARQATPQIMLFLPILIVTAYAAFIKAERKSAPWLLLVLLAGISAYSPGLIYWLAGALILSWRKFASNFSELPKLAAGLGIGLALLLITPLIVISALHITVLKQIFLVPADLPSPLHFGLELLRALSSLVFRSQGQSLLLLDNLSLLNITSTALAAFGAYALFTAARERAWPLGGAVLLGVILCAVSQNTGYLALAVPALSVAITAGLRYLYVEWRGIFPRNPVPKTFALLLIGILAATQIYFGLNYCLKAWPHSPAVKQAYVLK